MFKRIYPLLALVVVGLLGALLLTAGGNDTPTYDPILEAERLHQLDVRRADDQAVQPARQLAGALWQLLPPVLLAGLAVVGLGTVWLDRRARRRRLEPDANGFYPLLDPTVVARELAPELAQHIALTLAGGNMQALVQRHTAPVMLTSRGRYLEDAATSRHLAEDPTTLSVLPTAPTFADLRAQGFTPTTERMLLGYGQSGAVYGGIDALLSTAIAGRPGQGKTTALRFIYAQTVQAGGQVAVIDPHGAIVDALGEGHALWTASTAGELDDAAGWLQDELGRRGAAWKAGRRDFQPLLLLCDEWPIVGLASKAAVEAAGRVILEARKWGMYALVSGQGLPAGKFGGSLVRDALSSRFIFRTTPAQARMAGLDTESARMVEGLDVGRCVLDGPVEPQIVAIPNTTALDLASLVKTGATSPAEASLADFREASSEAPGKPAGRHLEASPREASSGAQSGQGGTPEEARIIGLFLSGADVASVVKEVYQVDSKTGGRRYQEKSAEVQQVLRRHVMA